MKGIAVLLALAGLLACKPTPSPSPSPTPEPTPTPTPCECVIPDANDLGWEIVSVEGPPYGELFVRAAREQIGNRCDKDKNETLALVAERVRTQHVCAAGPWADAVLVARPDGLLEEWHVIEWTRGCWYPLSKAFKGAWRHPSAAVCAP